ncbi:(2Fe-2S) ferredoxin [Dethiosulfatibacter aminovorans DSM 17477]|uniref:(2Fe-2S) ferredoxin n=1 Tax=Dethiosulfatibacter aminovorans DSM 17477 TaxID=1121476 RepID=A0A1M6CDI5_9FIRM|nr:2Fe-2S ferredoxin [Dethiosulfatibacter aminovorans]SHI58943.1 (2Fe-2S) ferredoxin [Dethiosulfatibacter aminovorans DSM 17477]
MEKLKHHIFVCNSARMNGEVKGVCNSKESIEIIQNFAEEISDRELDAEVMVTSTGCLGLCTQGPVVIVYPEGVWYGKVTPDDVEEIVESHIEGGEIVSRLEI